MSLHPALRGPAASILLLAAAAGCTPELPPARPDGGAPDGGLAFLPEAHTDFVFRFEAARGDGGTGLAVQVPRAGEPGPAPAPLVSAEAMLPDGAALPLARDRVTVVGPAARFRLEVAARIAEARLSLLDGQDAMVAAAATTEATATTRFTLTPAAPLRPGSSYTLRLDGADERLMRAEDGRRFEAVSLEVKVSGEPPAAPARKGKRGRRR